MRKPYSYMYSYIAFMTLNVIQRRLFEHLMSFRVKILHMEKLQYKAYYSQRQL